VLRPAGRIGFTIWAPRDLEAMSIGGAAIAELGVAGPDWTRAPLFGVEPPVLVEALIAARFEQPFARVLDVVIHLTGPEPLVEHFATVFDLDSYGDDFRSRLSARMETEIASRRDGAGTASLHNAAILAAARKPA
jgi:hypothetical protein